MALWWPYDDGFASFGMIIALRLFWLTSKTITPTLARNSPASSIEPASQCPP